MSQLSKKRSRNFQAGFTLLEILIVIAIIGSLMSVIGYYSVLWSQASRLREAAQQVVSDLQRARSQAQLTSEDSLIALCSTVSASSTCTPSAASGVYATSWGTGGTGPASGAHTLPYGITIINVASSGTASLTYSAPYAETDATGRVWQLNSPASRVAPIFIKIVGVTGKVSLSASAN